MDYRPMARANLESARKLLAEKSLEEWQKPENIKAYKMLTEHIIPEMEGFLRYMDSEEHKRKFEELREKYRRESEGE